MEMTMSKVEPKTNLVPLAIIGALFFIFGFVTWQNGALVPYLQMVCQLSETEALLVASAFYFAYTAMALPSAIVLEKLGYKNGMAIGLLGLVVGFLIYIPAAMSQEFVIFLVAQFVIGSGLTLLQTAANPYVVKVGPVESAAVRIMFMGLLNKGAGFLAPIAFTAVVLGDFAGVSAKSIAAMAEPEKSEMITALSNGLINPYIGMAIVFVVLAGLLKMSPLPELSSDDDEVEAVGDAEGAEGRTSILQFPSLILGAVTIFVYVGAEVSIGSFLVSFFAEPNIAGLEESEAAKYIAYYWGGAMVGRFIGAAVMQKIEAGKALFFVSVVAVLLVLVTILTTGNIAMIAILLVGLCNSIMFPTIFSLAINGLGKHTSQGSGILCLAIVGGAIVPLIQGVLADSIGIQLSFFLPILCYLFIAYYGLVGSKVKSIAK